MRLHNIIAQRQPKSPDPRLQSVGMAPVDARRFPRGLSSSFSQILLFSSTSVAQSVGLLHAISDCKLLPKIFRGLTSSPNNKSGGLLLKEANVIVLTYALLSNTGTILMAYTHVYIEASTSSAPEPSSANWSFFLLHIIDHGCCRCQILLAHLTWRLDLHKVQNSITESKQRPTAP